MIDGAAMERMRNTPAGETLTMVLRWTERPNLAIATGTACMGERVETIQAAYSAIKEGMIGRLGLTGSISVQDVPGTGIAAVTATAADWVRMAPILADETGVEVSLNRVVAIGPRADDGAGMGRSP